MFQTAELRGPKALQLAGGSAPSANGRGPGLTLLAALVFAAALGSCAGESAGETSAEYQWDLPDGVPLPRVPQENPITPEKVELGRHLFYDRRLSIDETLACADCHQRQTAFADARAASVGVFGDATRRNSMSLTNVAYNAVFLWTGAAVTTLEAQSMVPLFTETPPEMGLAGQEEVVLDRLREDARYASAFAEAYPDRTEPITLEGVTHALASFERTLLSFGSPFDAWRGGDPDALSDSALQGMELFFSETLECFHCHGGLTFTDSLDHSQKPDPERAFHNTGLYNLDGRGAYPASDTGLFAITGRAEDMGRFRAPTLRNIAVTAPYMHDGSIATLEAVIEHYAQGGRTIPEGPHAGVGHESPLKSQFVPGFLITPEETQDLLEFLRSLTDTAFLEDERFASPFDGEPFDAGAK